MKKPLTLTDHQKQEKIFTHRLISISFIIVIMLGLLIARLYELQIEQHERFSTLSDQNQLNLVPVRPNRGLIFDRNGLLLARNVPIFNLEIIPDRVKHLNTTIKQLQKIIPISPEDLETFKKEKRTRRHFDKIPLKVHLNDEEVAKLSVNLHRFPGVFITARMMRHYDLNEAFAHIVGYVGRINEKEMLKLDQSKYSATNYIGKVGIERYYEKILHGKAGYETVETDASGRVLRTIKRQPPISGHHLFLTIDAHLQFAAEKALGDHRGAVVVINPNNGEILAMVSKPSYNPNLFVKGISHKDYKKLRNSPVRPLYNRAIRGQYPLASTIKPFLALGALDEGFISTKTRIPDRGYYHLAGTSHVYRDWKKSGHGLVDVRRAIIVSCDTFFYTLAVKIGIRNLAMLLKRFGFGETTLIDMKEEIGGIVPDPEWKRAHRGAAWYKGDTVVSGIGQGYMLTTPLQLATAVSAMATKGMRFRPHLLLAKQLPGEKKIKEPLIEEHPIVLNNPKNWDIVRDSMRKVITSGEGTGSKFGRDAKYAVAAKTGTAQVFSLKKHTYLNKKALPELLRDHSLFIAFAPLDAPKIAVATIVENSKAASKVTRKVMDFYFGEDINNVFTKDDKKERYDNYDDYDEYVG